MLKYLLSSFGSILSYDLARSLTNFTSRFEFLTNHKIQTDVLRCFWYVDILILIIMITASPFIRKIHKVDIFDLSYVKKNRIVILLLSVPTLSSLLKSYLANSLSGDIILTYSMFCPFLSMLMSKIVFKNEKVGRRENVAFVLGFLGFFITKVNNVVNPALNILLLFYVVLNAASIISTRYISKTRNKIDGLVFENFIYVAIGLTGFAFFGGFSFRILFSWQILAIAVPSICHHIFVILGNQESKNTVQILIADFLKIIFTLFLAFLFFKKTLNMVEYAGIVIMLSGLVVFRFNLKNLH